VTTAGQGSDQLPLAGRELPPAVLIVVVKIVKTEKTEKNEIVHAFSD